MKLASAPRRRHRQPGEPPVERGRLQVAGRPGRPDGSTPLSAWAKPPPTATPASTSIRRGSVYAGLGYGKKDGSVARTDGQRSLVNLAFAYDLGVAKPMFYYGRARPA